MAKAKKSLGQHFLRTSSVAQRIAAAVSPEATLIVEVGPGHGILTEKLMETGNPLVLVEKDDMLSHEMHEKYGSHSHIDVVHTDFLKFPLDTLGGQFSLVGNFPYNISSQIVFRMLEFHNYIPEMVGMFQLEMARRIVAPPGSKEYGVISVMAQLHYTGELLFTLSPGAFNPPPKVKSAVIRLRHRPNPTLPQDYRVFRTLVKQAFSQRRKMLRNTLRGLIPDPVLKSDAFFQQRPEQLSVELFCKLADMAYNASNPDSP